MIQNIKNQGANLNIDFKIDNNVGNPHQQKDGECGMYSLYFIINIYSKKKSCIELQNFISNVVEEYDTFLLKKMLKKHYFIEINYN